MTRDIYLNQYNFIAHSLPALLKQIINDIQRILDNCDERLNLKQRFLYINILRTRNISHVTTLNRNPVLPWRLKEISKGNKNVYSFIPLF